MIRSRSNYKRRCPIWPPRPGIYRPGLVRPVLWAMFRCFALVADAALSFWGEVDPVSGKVISVGHPLEGFCLRGRVLVIPSTRGSSATPMMLKLACFERNAPAALVNVEVDGLAALGCIVNAIPMMTDLDHNPFAAIATDDYVVVDADQGFLLVTKA
jgi:predicted aconitase with swiveling domain